MNRDFIRITPDKTNDIFLVESFEELGRARNPDNVVLNGACYSALCLRYDEHDEYQLYGRTHFWTYKKGSLPCQAIEKEVIIKYTSSIFTFGDGPICEPEMEDNKYLEPEHHFTTEGTKPFRSFADVIKDGQHLVPDFAYRAPETFDWTEKCLMVYHLLRNERCNKDNPQGFMSPTHIVSEMVLRWSVNHLYMNRSELLGMLQEMKGVGLVEPDDFTATPDTSSSWRKVD